MDITITDFPALRDALDMIAEHDLQAEGATDDLQEAHDELLRLVRQTRGLVIDAIELMRAHGVELPDDEDE